MIKKFLNDIKQSSRFKLIIMWVLIVLLAAFFVIIFLDIYSDIYYCINFLDSYNFISFLSLLSVSIIAFITALAMGSILCAELIHRTNILQNNKGFSMADCVIGFVVIAAVATSVLLVFPEVLKFTTMNRDKEQSKYVAIKYLEQLKSCDGTGDGNGSTPVQTLPPSIEKDVDGFSYTITTDIFPSSSPNPPNPLYVSLPSPNPNNIADMATLPLSIRNKITPVKVTVNRSLNGHNLNNPVILSTWYVK